MPLVVPQLATAPSKGSNNTDAGDTSVHVAHFNDAGDWARHYSAVRMTLGTFWLGPPLVLLQMNWNKPELWIAVSAWAMCAFGLALYYLFTVATYKKGKIQRELLNAGRTTLGLATLDPAKTIWNDPGGIWPGLIAYPIVALVIGLWLFFVKPTNDVERAKDAAVSWVSAPNASWRWDSLTRTPGGLLELSALDNTSRRQWHFSIDASTGRVDRAEGSQPVDSTAAPLSVNALDLQTALRAKGSDPGPLDGKFGPRTLRAVKDFQMRNGLQATGIADPATLARLELLRPLTANP